MNVKKYLADTPQEAMSKMRSELGDDAVILSTRSVKKKGFKGIFARPMVEFMVAFEDEQKPKVEVTKKKDFEISKNFEMPRIETPFLQKQEEQRQAAGSSSTRVRSEDTLNSHIAVANNYLKPQGSVEDKLESLEQQLGAVSQMLEKLAQSTSNFRGELKSLYKRMINNNLSQALTQKYCLAVEAEMENSDADAEDIMRRVLGRRLGMPKALSTAKRPTVVMLVGPTGVGKTTTLAKLAAIYKLQHNKDVAFVTADVYRIGAVDQLKTYAEIMDVPVSIIYSLDEAKQIMREYSNKDIVFIDTPGKSPSDEKHCAEINELIRAAGVTDVYLVLSATTGVNNCRRILESYKKIPNFELIVTKTDEAFYGNIILNICEIFDKPVSYITMGQNVPDDIKLLEPAEIVNEVLRA